MRLAGKVALITGGGWNLGRATALRFAREGARVVVCGRRREQLEETVDAIASVDGADQALAVPTDVTQLPEMEAAVARTLEHFGALHGLVAMAGGGACGQPIDTVDPEEWARTIQVNLVGTFHAARAALPALRQAGGGTIVTCAGGGALFPELGAHLTDYASAKAALCRFTDQLAVELLDDGVRVNCAVPGMTWSDEQLAAVAAEEGRTGVPHPQREHNRSPEETAELVTWLTSDASAPLFGRTILAGEDWWKDPERVAAVHASHHRACLRRHEP